MFPFFASFDNNQQKCSPKANKERKLKFLKWIRDDLETRLAGVNAAISTIETQMERYEAA